MGKANENNMVVIQNIRFRGKRSIDWREVETYLKQYVGNSYQVTETGEIIYIGADFPDEYANSNYTKHLKGTTAKAKANAAQGIDKMIEIAKNRQHEKNRKEKHSKDALYGWYRYESQFALPVFGENGMIERYNVFQAVMLVRHAKDGKQYLYDIIDIKKETGKLFRSSDDLTQ